MISSLRYEDRLEGISNYLQWKVRITSVLKENKLWSFANTIVLVPASEPKLPKPDWLLNRSTQKTRTELESEKNWSLKIHKIFKF
jgi:hypothetical protein